MSQSFAENPAVGSADGAKVSRAATHRIGCVSYLNAKPLIEGFDDETDVAVHYDVPSRLLDELEAGEVDVALCPVIDYFRSRVPLRIVPVGGIGCDGPTHTVRLYSRVPIEQITTVHADTDSHTSVVLLRVVLNGLYDLRPALIDYHARENVADGKLATEPEAMLLIGDKVVTGSPKAVLYPHQLDLGEAWKRMTGLPFVFAVWMAREGAQLGELPARLHAARKRNQQRIAPIVQAHAAAHGWPEALATTYLGSTLKFDVGPPQLTAIARFAAEARGVGAIADDRPIKSYPR